MQHGIGFAAEGIRLGREAHGRIPAAGEIEVGAGDAVHLVFVLAAQLGHRGHAARLRGRIQVALLDGQMQLDQAAHGDDLFGNGLRLRGDTAARQLAQGIDGGQDGQMLLFEFVDIHGVFLLLSVASVAEFA